MNHFKIFFFSSFITFILLSCQQKGTQGFVEEVDMLMGQNRRSNCVIGPQVPFGSINPSPQTPEGGHDGYHPDQPIRGFGQLHVSGTGWGRYGQVFLSPQVGLQTEETGHDSPKSEEVAKPYFYGVNLDRYNIRVEVTPTHHSAIYRLSYPETDSAYLFLDIIHNIPMHIAPMVRGRFLEGDVKISADKRSFSGYGKYAGGYGDGLTPYLVYFAGSFNKTPQNAEKVAPSIKDLKIKGVEKDVPVKGAWWHFPKGETEILMKIGVSMKSEENAFAFLEDEIPSFDFERVRGEAQKKWNNTLGKIQVEGLSKEEKRVFYTSLYHAHLMPRDRTGDNPYWDSKEPYWDDHYDVWDTWRTQFPLMLLIQPGFVRSNISSFIDRYKHLGKVKTGFTSGLDMDWKQGGDDVDNIIADAFVKGLDGVDWNEAWELLEYHAEYDRSKPYLQYGFFAENDTMMSVSSSLEFHYNDFCVAQVAKGLGKEEAFEKYSQRAKNWRKLWNSNVENHGFSGFMGPRRATGEWVDFDPDKNYLSWNEFFYESNSWTYSLFIPHEIPALIEKCCGADHFVERLEYGLVNGLIDMKNEPSFLAIKAFNYAGRPDRNSFWTHKMMKEEYSLTEGYPDNEDSGAMGSWYVFSSLGLFPNAGQDIYLLNAPTVSAATLYLGNGKELKVTTENWQSGKYRIKEVLFNGQLLKDLSIRHKQIWQGGELHFVFE